MPRFQPKFISGKEKERLLDNLWTMIALLESREEVENFFRDLLSKTEAIMLARRIEIAGLLLKGENYDDICEKLKTAPNTVASVHRWLQSNNKGYREAIPRLKREQKRRETIREKNQKSKDPLSLEWIKRRYPLHFLILNAIDWAALKPPKKLKNTKIK